MPENQKAYFSAMGLYDDIKMAVAKKDIDLASNMLQKLIILLRESWIRTKEGKNETYYNQPLALSIISAEEIEDYNFLKQCSNYEQYQSFKNKVFEECEKNYIIVKHLQN